MKKKSMILPFLAAGMILSSSIGSVWAYFTTYVEAQGGYTLSLGEETSIEESFSSWTKHVTIKADADSGPVYVRARAYCSAYPVEYSDAGGKWTPGSDGFYYYSDMINANEATEELLVKISDVPSDKVEQKDFNVIVIYETTPVQYREDGSPKDAVEIDWNAGLDITTVEGGI